MNSRQLILTALAMTALASGCKQSDNMAGNTVSDTNAPSTTDTIKEDATNAWEKTKEVTTNAWSKTKDATAEAWTDVKDSLGSVGDYSYDKKNEFVAKAQADLDSLDQKIQAMSDKADTNLRAKRATLDQKLTDVKNATQDNWNDAKTAFKNAYDDVKNSIKQYWNGSTTSGSTTN